MVFQGAALAAKVVDQLVVLLHGHLAVAISAGALTLKDVLPEVSDVELKAMRNALRIAQTEAPDAILKTAAEHIGETANVPWLRCVLSEMVM